MKVMNKSKGSIRRVTLIALSLMLAMASFLVVFHKNEASAGTTTLFTSAGMRFTPEASAAYHNYPAQALSLINAQRTARGLSKVTRPKGNALEKVAVTRSKEIVIKWSHVRPNGQRGVDYIQAQVGPASVGECLAKGQTTPQAAVNGWMNSPTHKAVLLGKNYKTMVVALHITNGQFYWALSAASVNK